MAKSPAFCKAACALVHPLSMTAILLLMLNDHILRRFWPSWFTGKLGDLAWLFFFPFLMTMLLTCFIPAKGNKGKDLPALVAFSLVGGVFTLAKTVPGFHRLLIQTLEALLGLPVSLRIDPSDLVALPSLLLAWLVYRRIPEQSTLRLKPIWVVLPLAAFFTIANSTPYYQPGITWLKSEDGNIYAGNDGFIACSPDGGVTWECPETSYEAITIPGEVFCEMGETRKESDQTAWTTIQVPSKPGTYLRYKPNDDIEISSDGGQTWQVEFDIKPINDVQSMYYLKYYQGDVCVIDTPITAIADPLTANVIFAMGLEGVLVRRADGSYQSVVIDHFAPVDFHQPNIMWMLLKGELWLAALLGGLGVATLGLIWRRDWFIWCLIIGLWIAWGCVAFLLPPALQNGIAEDINIAASIGVSFLILPFTLNTFFLCGIFTRRGLLHLVAAWLGSMFLYFLPFLLWYQIMIPLYYLAAAFGILLSGGFLVWRWFVLKDWVGGEILRVISSVHSGMRIQKVGVLIMLLGIVIIPLSLDTEYTLFTGLGLSAIGFTALLVGLIRFWRAAKVARREYTT